MATPLLVSLRQPDLEKCNSQSSQMCIQKKSLNGFYGRTSFNLMFGEATFILLAFSNTKGMFLSHHLVSTNIECSLLADEKIKTLQLYYY